MGLFSTLKRISFPPLVMNEPSDDIVCRRAAVREVPDSPEGYIKAENMAFARACQIVDLSEMGAQLELYEEEIASLHHGGEMILFFSAEGAEVVCTLAWRRGRRMGVRFRGRRRRRPQGKR